MSSLYGFGTLTGLTNNISNLRQNKMQNWNKLHNIPRSVTFNSLYDKHRMVATLFVIHCGEIQIFWLFTVTIEYTI